MTIVLEHYKDSTGLHGEIEQDKYCSSFRVVISEPLGGGRARSLYRNTFTTKENARRAIRRHMTAPITRLDNKKGD